jgi:RNA polymerase sigma factor (sigma-70 family)
MGAERPADDVDADEALMLAYRDGDAGAFDRLYARHKGPVYRYLRRQAQNHADELAQDVWMRVINARGGYDVRARFTTWLYTIAHNRLMDHFRARGREAERIAQTADPDGDPDAVLEEQPHPDPPPERLLERREAAARILAALDALPDAQREAFVLQQEGELSVEEIATVTGVTRETAKSRLRYALAKLRASLRAPVNAEREPG